MNEEAILKELQRINARILRLSITRHRTHSSTVYTQLDRDITRLILSKGPLKRKLELFKESDTVRDVKEPDKS